MDHWLRKRHLTVVLCVTHECDVLPALAIFKGKRPLKIRVQDVFIIPRWAEPQRHTVVDLCVCVCMCVCVCVCVCVSV